MCGELFLLYFTCLVFHHLLNQSQLMDTRITYFLILQVMLQICTYTGRVSVQDIWKSKIVRSKDPFISSSESCFQVASHSPFTNEWSHEQYTRVLVSLSIFKSILLTNLQTQCYLYRNFNNISHRARTNNSIILYGITEDPKASLKKKNRTEGMCSLN